MQNGGARSDLESDAFDGLIYVTFPVAGVVLATKRPRNPLGWLMLAIGFFFLEPRRRLCAVRLGHRARGELPGAGLALALHYPGWVVFIGLSGFLLLLFPDGHLPSPRWRWFARAVRGRAGAAVRASSCCLPDLGAEYDLPEVENPLDDRGARRRAAS